MLFSSYPFVVGMMPVTLLGFFCAARISQRAACLWLVAVSLAFFGWSQPQYVPLLLGSIACNYAAACLLVANEHRPNLQRAIMSIAICGDLLLLFTYKYFGPLLATFREWNLTTLAFAPALPLGISFFTFTQIGFLIDCRHGLARERGGLHYALFVTFFPHLIAGPILHHREIMPQLGQMETWRLSSRNIAIGTCIFVIGLIKKSLLADPLSGTVAFGFAHPDTLGLFSAWHAALAYSLQLYFFSFPDIRTWQSGSRACSTSVFRQTLPHRIRRKASSTIGSVGI